ncbi:phospholipase A [Pasteurella sp. PK-2025]|uniref:phospholipase A n=1 Tax=unclassified Pasteurella TaxID=2621516 RepID=UPI003C785A0C
MLCCSMPSRAALAPSPYPSRADVLLTKHTGDFVGLMAYEQNYLMGSWSSGNFFQQDEARKDEIKFKLSVALPFWRGILGKNSVLAGSYTQKSWFQISNVKHSSPFRESNYEPQLFLAWKTDEHLPWGWTLRDVETGFNHQSNGRSNEQGLSRSWNRLYARASATKGNWIVEFKPWWRIPERAREDDNPDITRYRGYFDLSVGYRFDQHQVKFTGHYHPRSKKGGLEASYHYPITKHIGFYAQYYAGYGESLVDYQKNIQRIGLGIALNNVF